MLSKSDMEIGAVLSRFNKKNIDVAFLVPTPTGMEKSIMDATETVRSFLVDKGVHDYEKQDQGPENKITRKSFFVHQRHLEESQVSMYRPKTKNGDPRIWFSGLKRYAKSYNLLAIICYEDALYVVNCSDRGIFDSINDCHSPLHNIVGSYQPQIFEIAEELLDKLRYIQAKGFIRTLRAGDTGVGKTLEALLGLADNSDKKPDYKGIELKAKRLGRENRVTLFSQAPCWALSPIGSAWKLLSEYGYERNGKLRLNHEINAFKPNSLGFFLEVDNGKDWLKQNALDKQSISSRHLVTWEMEVLRGRLKEKHSNTFWVGANTRGRGANEEFHYVRVEHTSGPKVRNFEILLEGGQISVDYLMSQKGPKTVRDHGYLFKMHQTDFEAMFPPSLHYDLARRQ